MSATMAKTMRSLPIILSLCPNRLANGFIPPVGFPRAAIELRGGHDAAIGAADPAAAAPIQFFLLPNHTCPYAQRTHIALLELGLSFEMSEVTGMPKPEWYLEINPRGKVPALRVPAADDGAVIYESSICGEFLCDYAASLPRDQALMPADPFARASIRLLNDHCDSVFAKTQFTFLMNKDETKDDELRAEMEEALSTYEDALAKSEGPYLLGEEFTLADVHVFPFVQRLVVTLKHWKDYELPADDFPRLLRWLDSCLERDSVKESSMTKEKTIEIYTRFVGADYKFGGLNTNK